MLEALLIGAIVVGVLACPTMMWLGRRGIGPGCAMMRACEPEPAESVDALRRRQQELSRRIAELERDAEPTATAGRP